MAPLSRTTSQASANSDKSQSDAASTAKAASPIEAFHPQVSPASASFTRPTPPLRSRTPSHTLLHSALNAPAGSRKSRFADAGTSEGKTGRASISMPPPANKPSTYKPSPSRQFSGNLTMNLLAEKEQNSSSSTGGLKAADQSALIEDFESNVQTIPASEPCSPLPPDSILKPPTSSTAIDSEGNRLSLSSLYSLGSALYNGTLGVQSAPASTASSNAGSVKSGIFDPSSVPLSPTRASFRSDLSASVTTATDPVSVTANTHPQHQGSYLPSFVERLANASDLVPLNTTKDETLRLNALSASQSEGLGGESLPRQPLAPRRSRSRTKRQASGSTVPSSTASPNNSDRSSQAPKKMTIGRLGVCALDVKARSKASRNILTRLQSEGDFDIVVFGDKVILDEDVENWPLCDFLISFFSDGFPLDKAIAYAKLRKPFTINDLPMQKILWDRRICLRVLDCMGVPTPSRLEVNRDGGPRLESPELAAHVQRMSGVRLVGPPDGTGGGMPQSKEVKLVDDGDTLIVDGIRLSKPFVEKPISGEDHNIRIYFPKTHATGGGGRKLFRKIGNKSSEWDPEMTVPRAITEEGSSYIYEQFLHVNNAEDIKAYTVGRDFCHAETRKSPVVDGLVQRNTHGKEIRYVTKLNPEEQSMATRITDGFGQRVCGFDLLRVGGKSFVIDVNGWSFVKDNKEYYDDCAKILKQICLREKQKGDGSIPPVESRPDAVSEKSVSSRKNTTSHRNTLKTLLKSPSMSKLGGNSRAKHAPEVAQVTAPLSSPPSIDKGSVPSKVGVSNANNQIRSELLPPTAGQLQGPEPVLSDSQSAPPAPEPASKHAWKLKGMVSVIRHADRTPKQKFKFTFHTQPFVELLKGHQEEVLLKGEAALNSVLNAVNRALQEGVEDPEKLQLLKTSLARKGAWVGTKVQIKPMFRKRKVTEMQGHNTNPEDSRTSLIAAETLTADPEDEKAPLSRPQTRHDSLTGMTLSRFSAVENDLILDKLQLIIKWGGEPTHSARYQAHDLGENMRNDLLLMNKDILEGVRVFTSSERRVSTSAQIWAASFLDQKDVGEDYIEVRKDLLDDSNAAKDVMDKVKKKLKLLLREGHQAPPQFAWPPNTPEPSIVVGKVVELMNFHRQVMRDNFKRLPGSASASLSALRTTDDGSPVPNAGGGSLARAEAIAKIQKRWCCGEDPELFKERWEKLFTEFCDSEKVDPSKLSELYDTMKFDALHNRNFLEWVFKPAEGAVPDTKPTADASLPKPEPAAGRHERKGSVGGETKERSSSNLAQRMGMGMRRKSMVSPPSPQPFSHEAYQESYFKLFVGSGQSKAKQDPRLEKLRELYKYAKVLFDFVCPQEYGIADSEKLEIGLLTSLPLLKEIVQDLEAVQASDEARSYVYFTKESHIYTLLNCILEGGIKTKIERNAIPELDYLSTITFELYESEDKETDTFTYSIRITITPGCHTFDLLDVHLDSKHSIGCAQRRSLTDHQDWREVIETLRAKFGTVKLPKSFLAVNVSDRHASESASITSLCGSAFEIIVKRRFAALLSTSSCNELQRHPAESFSSHIRSASISRKKASTASGITLLYHLAKGFNATMASGVIGTRCEELSWRKPINVAHELGFASVDEMRVFIKGDRFWPFFEAYAKEYIWPDVGEARKVSGVRANLATVEERLIHGEWPGSDKFSRDILKTSTWDKVDHQTYLLYRICRNNINSSDCIFFRRALSDSEINMRIWALIKYCEYNEGAMRAGMGSTTATAPSSSANQSSSLPSPEVQPGQPPQQHAGASSQQMSGPESNVHGTAEVSHSMHVQQEFIDRADKPCWAIAKATTHTGDFNALSKAVDYAQKLDRLRDIESNRYREIQTEDMETDFVLSGDTVKAAEDFDKTEEYLSSERYQRQDLKRACGIIGVEYQDSKDAVFRIRGMALSQKLMYWQVLAIAALITFHLIEKSIRGCVLGDVVGLGKTWEIIGTLLQLDNMRKGLQKSGKTTTKAKPTLVLVPQNILLQWIGQIFFVTPNVFTVYRYHGDTRGKRFKPVADERSIEGSLTNLHPIFNVSEETAMAIHRLDLHHVDHAKWADWSEERAHAQWLVIRDMEKALIVCQLPAVSVYLLEVLKILGIKAEAYAAFQSMEEKQSIIDRFNTPGSGLRVLIIPYALAGFGLNLQKDCWRIHAIECAWNLAALEQAIGRVRRLGNPQPIVYVYEYIVPDTFDDKAVQRNVEKGCQTDGDRSISMR
ncbi:MAG: hypothetical protein Q9210_003210 [Variospora velana]